MKTIDVETMGLHHLSASEIAAIEGGAWPRWLKGLSWTAVVGEIIDNWDDIKKGFSNGWHFADKR